MRKYTVLPLLLLAVSFLAINCSKKDSTPPNYDGNWSGTTSQGKTFSFTVSGNKVTAININYTLSGNCSPSPSGESITFSGGNTISGNSFSLTGSSTAFSGTFSSGNAATGTFDVNFTGNPPGCSSTGSGTWSATK